jgi:hypothetical protein
MKCNTIQTTITKHCQYYATAKHLLYLMYVCQLESELSLTMREERQVWHRPFTGIEFLFHECPEGTKRQTTE